VVTVGRHRTIEWTQMAATKPSAAANGDHSTTAMVSEAANGDHSIAAGSTTALVGVGSQAMPRTTLGMSTLLII
jgi:hypothetical protein